MNKSRALYNSEEAVTKFGNRYEMVLAASCRYRELRNGYRPMIKTDSGPVGTALEEIEAGIIGREYALKNHLNNSIQSAANRKKNDRCI